MAKQKAQQLLTCLPDTLCKPGTHYLYGTAGYRGVANSDLTRCISRASLVALVRSSTFAGKYVGLVITASHNPAHDNGLKIVDHNGDCLDESWEKLIDEAVNCEDDALYGLLNRMHRKYGQMKDIGDGLPAKILMGRDTRESGKGVVEAVKTVLESLEAEVYDYGEVSTPQLHWLVRNSNAGGKLKAIEKYIDHMTRSYQDLAILEDRGIEGGRRRVDTANGVVKRIFEDMKGLDVDLVNGEGVLNYQCGSDYIKSKRRGLPGLNNTDLIASFDGDADRLIYFRSDPFYLVDGDRLCCLLVLMLVRLLRDAGSDLKVGAVLSFYSNSAAVKWVERIAPVSISHTGVKNFTRLAKTYDVGVYFEPNGHGSCYFSPRALKQIKEGDSVEYKKLLVLSGLFDPSIGDAFANFLVFETVVDFGTELYEEFPTRDIVVHVQDKNVLVVDAQNEVVVPEKMQGLITDLLKKFRGTGFVRASGTENCVRVHVEARKQSVADELCVRIGQVVYDMCVGVGPCPEISYVEEENG